MTRPTVSWDKAANAAAIVFGDSPQPRRGLEVQDRDGDVVAVLHFSVQGELLEIELLEADVQLPMIFRGEPDPDRSGASD